jgi:ssDNA-binding Zn-finger/Zn-ribbon topoisomerase 1
MLKRMLNSPERITYARLRAVCELHVAEVHAKIRLADVLPIEGSGLPEASYEFALQSHYDFVIAGRDQVPLFAIEFDGPQHGHAPQSERDAKKDELSRRFGLSLLRIHAADLCRTESRLDGLTELIEKWFEDHTELATRDNNMQPNRKCPLCGSEMVRKPGKYGPFLSCATYPACKGSRELLDQPNRSDVSGWRKRKVLITCSICAALVVVVVTLLLRFPYGTSQGGGQSLPAGETQPTVAGAHSSMTLQEKRAYVGDLKQSDYPVCPNCGTRMTLRHNGHTGEPFFGCSDFPRCRGTREVQYPR